MKQLIKSISTLAPLFLMLFFAEYGYSQPCVQEELIKLPGEWKQGIKGSVNNVSSANLVKEKEVVQSILKIFMDGYKPMGCKAQYSGVYGFNKYSGKNWISDPYGLSVFFLRYLCDPVNKEKYYVDISTPTNLQVSVNKFTPLNKEIFAAELPDDHEEGFIRISKLPEYKNGYYFMESNVDYDKNITTYFWMIGYSGKLPYKHVTQKEYLLKTLATYKIKIQEINERELARKSRDILTDEDIEFYIEQRDYYRKPIVLIEEMLQNKSAAELESPAVILHPGDLQPFAGLVEMGTPYADILIVPNPDYYNRKLPKYAPQLFSINLTISKDDPVFEDVLEKISKAVNVKKFKEMLGETFDPELH